MEANFVKKIGEFTPEFLDGINKVFSANAILHIKVEYGEAKVTAPKTTGKVAKAKTITAVAEAPKKRGRKAGLKSKTASIVASKKSAAQLGSVDAAPKKRGRQPGFKPKPKTAASTDGAKKRGPKPKTPVEA